MIDEPACPQPEDFGVSTQSLEADSSLERELERLESFKGPDGCVGGFLGYLLAISGCVGGMSLPIGDPDDSGSFFARMVVGLVLFGLVAMVLGRVSSSAGSARIARARRRLDEFRQASPGIARFRAAQATYRAQLAECRRSTREFWTGMSGHQVALEFGRVLRLLGYNVEATPASADWGIDLILRVDGNTTIVQCKAWGNQVPPGPVRELQGVREPGQDAWLVGLVGFTRGAIEFAEQRRIRLLDLNDVLALVDQAKHRKKA